MRKTMQQRGHVYVKGGKCLLGLKIDASFLVAPPMQNALAHIFVTSRSMKFLKDSHVDRALNSCLATAPGLLHLKARRSQRTVFCKSFVRPVRACNTCTHTHAHTRKDHAKTSTLKKHKLHAWAQRRCSCSTALSVYIVKRPCELWKTIQTIYEMQRTLTSASPSERKVFLR